MPQQGLGPGSSTGDARIAVLDGWRGLAITMVLAHHFFPIRQINFGTLGVDLFFVLSGLLICRVLYVKGSPLPHFFLRRVARLFPLFFIYVSFWYVFDWISGTSEEYRNYLSTVFFLRSYFPADSSMWQTGIPIGHIWSLNVEEHSYLLLALLTLLPGIKPRAHWVLGGLGVLCIFIRLGYELFEESVPVDYEMRTEVAASYLLLGAAYLLARIRYRIEAPAWAPPLALVLAILCFSEAAPPGASWAFAPFLLAFAVNHLDRIPVGLELFLRWRLLRSLGIWSYSLYLWQQPFYYYGVKHGASFSFAAPVCLVGAVATALLSFYLLEDPVRRSLYRRWTPDPLPAPA